MAPTTRLLSRQAGTFRGSLRRPVRTGLGEGLPNAQRDGVTRYSVLGQDERDFGAGRDPCGDLHIHLVKTYKARRESRELDHGGQTPDLRLHRDRHSRWRVGRSRSARCCRRVRSSQPCGEYLDDFASRPAVEVRKKLHRPASDHPWKIWKPKPSRAAEPKVIGGAVGGSGKSKPQDFPPPPTAHSLSSVARGHF